jgi:DNA sulfur modification protein DndD
MKALLATGWRSVAAAPLRRVLAEVQERNSKVVQHDQQIAAARIRIAVLEDRSRGGTCPSCEQPLPPPDAKTAIELDEARSELARLIKETGGGTVDLDLERRVTSLIDVNTIPQYVLSQRKLEDLRMVQYQRRLNLDQIADRLRGHKVADIRALGQRNKALESALKEFRKLQDDTDHRATDATSELKKLSRQLERLPGANPQIAFESSFFSFVDDLLGQTIAAYRERVRREVERDAEKMFLRLIRDPAGYGGLRISPDYKVELLDPEMEARPTSEGGKQLLALALIGALKRAAVRGGPVVLDSPLGRLDLEHRANVLQIWIPSLGSQAILLVQSGELTKEDAHQLLGSSIGREYEMIRPDNNPERVQVGKVR